ncbi:MAG: hypothetical protein JXA13_06575 [Anaerolineales bacterium]|nr:hypothetical protein [Anaerolineales bacterium]
MAFIFLYLGLSSLRFSDHHWLTRAGAIMVGIMLASLVFFFLPNPHNQEDNSRGVIGLTTLAHWAKNKPGIKEKIQFAFLDN